MKKYKMKEYDPIHDLWILQKRVFLFLWLGISVGSKEKIEKFIKDKENDLISKGVNK
jgi:hypothetical protein